MPRDVKDIPGRLTGLSPTSKSFNDKQYQANKSGWFPRFTRNKTRQLGTTWTDTTYVTLLLNYAVQANLAYYGDLFNMAVEQGHRSGNMKDVDAAQATAAEAIATNSLLVLANLGPMKTLIDLLDNHPENEADDLTVGDGLTGNTAVPIYSLENFDLICKDLENRGALIPKLSAEIFNTMMNWYFHVRKGAMIGAQTFQDMYVVPFTPYYKMSSLEGYISTWMQNQGAAKIHCDKLGIKLVPFKASMLDAKMISDFYDPNMIAYFNHAPFCVYKAGDAVYRIGGYPAFSADGSEARPYYFKDSPNESKIHAYAKLFDGYNLTYNKYGGLFYNTTAPNTGDYVNAFLARKTESSEFLGTSIRSNNMIPWFTKYLWMWKNTAVLNMSLTGTYLSADFDITYWPYADDGDLWSGAGLNENRSDSILIAQAIQDTF